ncbi:MAG TPA: ATP-binding protein [Woeseiaceae bacterium]|nr:ATP-binding protein [Woeseiaceae bacterium]
MTDTNTAARRISRRNVLLRLLFAAATALVVAIGTIALWHSLHDRNDVQITRIVLAESYGARSQLIRKVETMFAALHNVRVFWSAYGHLPRDQWELDAGIELNHFGGIDVLLWDDPVRNVRFVRSPEKPAYDYRPPDEEWATYAALLKNAKNASTNSVGGPFVRSDGSQYFEVYFVDWRGQDQGVLAAVIDIDEMLAGMLEDVSPGFAISVFDGDTLLYQRGEPAQTVPAKWTMDGMIKSSLGTLWKVKHEPTAAWVDSITSPAIDLILLLGLLISALVGTLTFENGRARARAIDAEMAELEVAELNRTLEQQVAERTNQLNERTADLQTLTDSVAHDLRNPLNTISVNVQLLEEHAGTELSDDARRVLQRLPPSVHQMANILDRLLGMSEVSHATFEREQVNMRQVVEEIIEDLTINEPDPPIEFKIADLPDANADHNLLQVLLLNLVDNAIKYTQSKSLRVITIGFDSTAAETVYFIKDNGIGFDQEYADRLFGAFNRLGDASAADGVGLGLTIAARAVERHGGGIWAKGKKDRGATFYFTLGDSV